MAEWRQRLPPGLIEFLEEIDIVVSRDGTPPRNDVLAYHLQSIPGPRELFRRDLEIIADDGYDCILLFPSNFFSISHRTGTIMDLADMTVCYLPSHLDFEPEYSQWHPLDLVLERLNYIIEYKKYEPVPWDSPVEEDPKGCFVSGWKTNPWTEPILEETLMEYDDLIQAITDRLPRDTDWVDISTEEPLASAYQLQLLSSIGGFPRAFLQRAKKPPFKFIAPGLTIYDASSSSSSQTPHPQVQEHPDTGERRYMTPYRELNGGPVFHDPLILFPPADDQYKEQQAGLWILPEWDWADSVALVLPYTLSSYPLGDGRSVQWPTSTRLFQSRGCPYFVDHRTRLASMLRRWRRLVEEGIWTVGPDGVEGDIDFYRQAEDPEKQKWFTSGEDCFEFRIPVSIEVEL